MHWSNGVRELRSDGVLKITIGYRSLTPITRAHARPQ
jgi:hypothetical protein